VVDGFYGENVSKAVAGFEVMRGLSVDGKLDPDVAARPEDDAPVLQHYVVSKGDATGLVDKIPKDYGEKAKMEILGCTSVAERLSERFHMDIDLVKTLNPDAKFAPGETLFVVSPGFPRAGKVKRIDANKKTGQLVAYAEDGSLLAVYLVTIGSEDNPAPSSIHKVKGVARMPVYRI
jgi:lipoprotein-anchoring transpeptidase ErfK/SrfK